MTDPQPHKPHGNDAHDVVAVVIVYFPDIATLKQLVQRVRAQVRQVCLVINQSEPDLREQLQAHGVPPEDFVSILMTRNMGVAAAQNAGIDYAREAGARHVLLLDQDSLPYDDMVAELTKALATHPNAAAAGPCYLDPRTNNPPPFLRHEGLRLRRIPYSDGAIVEVDYLISSGCLIPLEALTRVGPMREDLFIDYIDIEWGLRAKSAGLKCYGVFTAGMYHSLGDHPITIFGRGISLHSSMRNYYLFRNATLLYKEKWIPLNWKLNDSWRLARRFFFYLFFGGEFFTRLRMMTLGIFHGLLGRSGERLP